MGRSGKGLETFEFADAGKVNAAVTGLIGIYPSVLQSDSEHGGEAFGFMGT